MDQQKKYEGILEYFLHWERETPNAVFLRQPKGSNWKEYSWREVGFEARKIQANLTRLGIHKGDRVALLSQNCAEWIMTDIGIMMGGFVSVPLYANVNASTLNDILTHSEAKLLFIGKMNDKDWDAVKHSIPDIIQTVTFNGYERESITSWKQFLQTHEIPDTVPDVSKHDVFTIIYTSGSTGTPKGVVHCNNSVINALNIAGKEVLLDKQGNRFFSYLPLSHAAERGLVECGAIFSGGSISFVESLESFASNIKNSKPTHFFGVPRIWEKFQEKILESLSQQKLNILLKLPLISSIIKPPALFVYAVRSGSAANETSACATSCEAT